MPDSTDTDGTSTEKGTIRTIIERLEPEGVEHREIDWEPLIAGGASLIVPGAGQWYNEQYARGVAFLAVAVALLLSYVFIGETAILVGIFLEPLLRLVAGYDAFSTARIAE